MYNFNGIPFRELHGGNPPSQPPPPMTMNGQHYFSQSTRLRAMEAVESILAGPAISLNGGKNSKQATHSPPSSNQYRYEAPHELYSMGWSTRMDGDKLFRLAVGSCQDITGPKKGQDSVQILQFQLNDGTFNELTSFQHNYPPTKLAWIPDVHGKFPDLLATSGDYLRIWKLNSPEENAKTSSHSVQLAMILNNDDSARAMGMETKPLTSFDWNQADPSLLVTASLDNSCTIWTLETGQAVASHKNDSYSGSVLNHLLAHDKHVYDVAFSHLPAGNRDVFASVGDEGSLRQFDLRTLVKSTILYDDPHGRPLVRLAWGKCQPYYLAFFAQDSNEVTVLDIRFFAKPLTTLKNHEGNVNAMSWAPHAENHIVTAGDDEQVLIWDIHHTDALHGPVLRYKADGAVNQVQWSEVQPSWISVCFDNCLELLRVQ